MKKTENRLGFLIISTNLAGAENALKNIVKSLSKFKMNSIIYCNQEIYNHYLDMKNISVYNLGPLNITSKLRYLNYIRMYFRLRKILSTEKPSILFVMLEGSLFVAYGLNKSHNLPSCLVLHGTEIDNFLNSKGKLKDNLFLKKWMITSPRVISVGKEQIKTLPEKYKKKTIVIPNGVDFKIFRSIKGIKQKKNVILFVGRFIDTKGIREILQISKQLPQYEFWFAGQGLLHKEIKGDNIKNLGFKTTKELVQLYNQATICIFPSHIESFGLVGLEAMACGRAVIATPLGFSEYIQNGKDGIIIPSKDENALRRAIVDLMTNKKKRRMLEKNARKKALKYSWDKITEKYLKVFRRIVRE